MRLIYTLAIVCLGLVACSGSNNDESPEVDKYNLDAEPTDGGAFVGEADCADKARSTKWCVRDGDESFLICRSTKKIEEIECGQQTSDRTSPQTYCYGARDGEDATCITEERLLETTESIEPGSDLWLEKKREAGEAVILPDDQLEDFAVTVDEVTLLRNEDGDIELGIIFANNAAKEVDTVYLDLTSLDADRAAIETRDTGESFLDFQPSKRAVFTEVFAAPTDLQAVAIKIKSASLDGREHATCTPGIHRQCSWTATLE